VGVFGIGRDITYRKTAERELNRVAQDLRLLIDTANAPIFGIDKKGRAWGLLRTSTRPTLNPSSSSARLYEHHSH